MIQYYLCQESLKNSIPTNDVCLLDVKYLRKKEYTFYVVRRRHSIIHFSLLLPVEEQRQTSDCGALNRFVVVEMIVLMPTSERVLAFDRTIDSSKIVTSLILWRRRGLQNGISWRGPQETRRMIPKQLSLGDVKWFKVVKRRMRRGIPYFIREISL